MGWGLLITLLCVCFTFSGQIHYDYLKEQSYINPASGLSFVENPAVLRYEPASCRWQQTNSSYFDWQQNQIFLTIPYKEWGFGLSIHHQNIGGLQETYEDGSGTYQTLSSFSHQKIGAIIGLSKSVFSENVSIGLNSKLYYQKIMDQSIYAYGFDIGVIVKTNFGLSFEYVLNDISQTQFKWSDSASDTISSSSSLACTWQFGQQFIAYRYQTRQASSTVRIGLSFTQHLSILANCPIQNPEQSQVKITFNQQFMEFYYQYDFDQSLNQQNEFGVSIKL